MRERRHAMADSPLTEPFAIVSGALAAVGALYLAFDKVRRYMTEELREENLMLRSQIANFRDKIEKANVDLAKAEAKLEAYREIQGRERHADQRHPEYGRRRHDDEPDR